MCVCTNLPIEGKVVMSTASPHDGRDTTDWGPNVKECARTGQRNLPNWALLPGTERRGKTDRSSAGRPRQYMDRL